MGLLSAKHESEAEAGRAAPDTRTSLTGKGAVSLANESDEEGEGHAPAPSPRPLERP